ncbi:MAG: hypothetical protein ACXWA9_16280, partial [Acidimicrobiia bacterium]
MMRRRLPSLRRCAGFVALFGLIVATSSTWADNGSAATQQASLQLKGEGSWGAYREILTWQNDLAGATKPIDFSYAAHGSLLGRQDFLA